MRRVLAVSLLGAAAAVAASSSVADATTGVGAGLPQPRVSVAPAIGDIFVGAYTIKEIDRRAGIRSGELMMDYTEIPRPHMVGNLTIYGYDSAGRQSTSSENVYPFQFKRRMLRAGILTQGSLQRIGAVTFQLPTDPNNLSGTITWRGGTYDVVYQRADDDDGPFAIPDARQIDPAPPKLTKDGVGPDNAAAYGAYRLAPSNDDAGVNASLYAPLVRVAAALSTNEIVADDGSLRLFGLRDGPRGPAKPTGIVNLHGPGSTRVEYLTDWRWGGAWRTAVVRGGSTEGPAVGRFVAKLEGGRLIGTLTTGKQHLDLTFER
jgi:hypothetical protein